MTGPPPLLPAPPAYAKRLYFGPVYPNQNSIVMPEPGEGLVIYIRAIRSRYREDWHSEVDAWRRRRAYMGQCYSVVEPEGEIGFTALADVTEISEEEFLGAMAALRSRDLPRLV